MSGERIYAAVKTIVKSSTPPENFADLVYGIVKSVSPLRIDVENKFTLEPHQILTSFLCDKKTARLTIPSHVHPDSEGTTGDAGAVDMEIELWRGLQVGDRVIMLRHSGGQGFYVLQRVGE